MHSYHCHILKLQAELVQLHLQLASEVWEKGETDPNWVKRDKLGRFSKKTEIVPPPPNVKPKEVSPVAEKASELLEYLKDSKVGKQGQEAIDRLVKETAFGRQGKEIALRLVKKFGGDTQEEQEKVKQVADRELDKSKKTSLNKAVQSAKQKLDEIEQYAKEHPKEVALGVAIAAATIVGAVLGYKRLRASGLEQLEQEIGKVAESEASDAAQAAQEVVDRMKAKAEVVPEYDKKIDDFIGKEPSKEQLEKRLNRARPIKTKIEELERQLVKKKISRTDKKHPLVAELNVQYTSVVKIMRGFAQPSRIAETFYYQDPKQIVKVGRIMMASEDITEDEAVGLATYLGGDYKRINTVLRNFSAYQAELKSQRIAAKEKEHSFFTQELLERLEQSPFLGILADKALRKLPKFTGTILTDNSSIEVKSLNRYLDLDRKFHGNYQVGQTVLDPGFSSTTHLKEPFGEEATGLQEFVAKANTIFRINFKKPASEARYVEDFKFGAKEGELLYPPGTKFKVTDKYEEKVQLFKANRKKNSVLIIELEEV